MDPPVRLPVSLTVAAQLSSDFRDTSDALRCEIDTLRIALEQLQQPAPTSRGRDLLLDLLQRVRKPAAVTDEAEHLGFVERSGLLEQSLRARDRQLGQLQSEVDAARARDEQRACQLAELQRLLSLQHPGVSLSELTPAAVIAALDAQARVHRADLSAVSARSAEAVRHLEAEVERAAAAANVNMLREPRPRRNCRLVELERLCAHLGVHDAEDLSALADSVPRCMSFALTHGSLCAHARCSGGVCADSLQHCVRRRAAARRCARSGLQSFIRPRYLA
jgi:hypothetical protein